MPSSFCFPSMVFGMPIQYPITAASFRNQSAPVIYHVPAIVRIYWSLAHNLAGTLLATYLFMTETLRTSKQEHYLSDATSDSTSYSRQPTPESGLTRDEQIAAYLSEIQSYRKGYKKLRNSQKEPVWTEALERVLLDGELNSVIRSTWIHSLIDTCKPRF